MMGFLRRLLRRRRLVMDAASLSACGLVRPDNQDQAFVNPAKTFFCVADGMGGGEGGAEASGIVCRCLTQAVARHLEFPGRVKQIAAAIHEANTKIRAYAREKGYRQMATTVALFAVNESDSASALIGSVGDSRIYRFRRGEWAQLTHDHTLAGELSRRGSMRGMMADLSGNMGHLSHVLTRAVGVEAEVQPDWRRLELQEGDWYLLCTDGLYTRVDEKALADSFAAGGTPQDIIARLESRTLQAGAQDNYTFIVFRVGGAK